ncbi:MAG: CoA transferase, partial [Chloroflexota bacterium]
IDSKELGVVPLTQNLYNAQIMFMREVCEGLDRGIHSFTCLKARQLGMTWLCLAYGLWQMMFKPIAKPLVFSRTEDDAMYLLGVERLLTDPRYDTHAKRMELKHELYPIMDEAFSKRTRDEWRQIFRARNYRCEPCLDYKELTETAQFKEDEVMLQVHHPTEGPLNLFGSPVLVGDNAWRGSTRCPPVLGEHTREVMAEINYTSDQVESLLASGAVIAADESALKFRGRKKGQRALRAGGGVGRDYRSPKS